MSSSVPTREELFRLFGGAIHGTLNQDEADRLRALLMDKPEVRALWFEALDVECGLRQIPMGAASGYSKLDDCVVEEEPVRKESLLAGAGRHVMWAASIAVATLVGTGLVLNRSPKEAPPVARFGTMQEVLWASPEKNYKTGEAIHAGDVLELLSGSAEVVFRSGATTKLEAPAIFKICSAESAFLTYGRIAGEAPGNGSNAFTIQTPTSRVMNFEAEFIVSAEPDGRSHVELKSGEATVHIPGLKEEMHLSKGGIFSTDAVQSGVAVRIETGDGSPAFRLPSIEPPFENPAAATSHGAPTARVLHERPPVDADGLGATGDRSQGREKADTFLLTARRDGRYFVDLGRLIPVTKINTYSWKSAGSTSRAGATRAQNFTLYGLASSAAPEAVDPAESGGWQLIAQVNTDSYFAVDTPNTRPDQQACSFTAVSGCLGKFRYLLVVPQSSDLDLTASASALGVNRFDVYADPWSF